MIYTVTVYLKHVSMIYSYAAPKPMKLRPPLQNSEKLLVFWANLDEFLLTAKQIFIND